MRPAQVPLPSSRAHLPWSTNGGFGERFGRCWKGPNERQGEGVRPWQGLREISRHPLIIEELGKLNRNF